jgi:signal transduction histidine kinase
MFKSARIKITAYYLLIIMAITFSFSAAAYRSTTRQMERALEMQERRVKNRFFNIPNPPFPPNEPIIDKETVKQIEKETLTRLLLINVLILIGAGIPGYWLAGKTLKPIEEMAEKQKKFTVDAAHELKTPLTAMKTNLEVNLRDKNLDLKKAKTVLESTINDIDSLTLLTNSLILQSKYQNYKNGKRDSINLKESAQNVIAKLEPIAKEKKIKINLDADEIKTQGDENFVRELLTILVDNAIKFSKKEGKIEISIKAKNNCAQISVKDNGIGIDEKDIPYIFDRFYKADTSRSKNEALGFGLGLSIAKEIVEAHKGKISVKSKKGTGTEFLIKLPLIQ